MKFLLNVIVFTFFCTQSFAAGPRMHRDSCQSGLSRLAQVYSAQCGDVQYPNIMARVISNPDGPGITVSFDQQADASNLLRVRIQPTALEDQASTDFSVSCGADQMSSSFVNQADNQRQTQTLQFLQNGVLRVTNSSSGDTGNSSLSCDLTAQ